MIYLTIFTSDYPVVKSQAIPEFYHCQVHAAMPSAPTRSYPLTA